MVSTQTIFIVEDDEAVRDSVAALVRFLGKPVETFVSAEEFLSHLDRTKSGCLIVDVRLGGMSGLELQKRLNEEGLHLGVVIVTGYADIPTAVAAMQAGAITFLEKPYRDEELITCVEQALRKALDFQTQSLLRQQVAANVATLSKDELAVMERMVAGMPNKRIAAELDIGLRTVELRRANVMKKFHVETLADLVRLVITADPRRMGLGN